MACRTRPAPRPRKGAPGSATSLRSSDASCPRSGLRYRFETDGGKRLASRSLPIVFAAPRLSLHVRARLQGGLSRRSAIVDGFDGFVVHLAEPRRHPVRRLGAPRSCRRTSAGWDGASRGRRRSAVTSTTTSRCRTRRSKQQSGGGEYNFRPMDASRPTRARTGPTLAEWAATTGTDWLHVARGASGQDQRGSALEDGVVYHTDRAYAWVGRSLGHVPVARPGHREGETRRWAPAACRVDR